MTFLLPQGRFRYTRTPMGLNASSDFFCAVTDNIIREIEGVTKLVDDLLGDFTTFKELVSTIVTLCKRFRKNYVIIHPDKFVINTKVSFGGLVVDANKGPCVFYPTPPK